MEKKVDIKNELLSARNNAKIEERLNIEKKSYSGRRKKNTKPRRIEQSVLAFNANQNNSTEKNLKSVLESVLHSRQTDEQLEKSHTRKSAQEMIDIHETLPVHHHRSPKNSSSSPIPPRSVESPQSLYLSEKIDDLASVKTNAIEPFVKVQHQNSNDSIHQQVLYDVSNSLRRSSSSEQRQRTGSISPLRASPKANNGSQEVPEVVHRSHSNLSSSSPSNISSSQYLHSSAYDVISGNPASAIVAMAAGMGLPTMIPSSGIITPSIPPLVALHQQRFADEKSEKSSFTDVGYTNGRGIIGSSGKMPRRSSISPSPEERAQYKRPPHTYPALIASAILDSPGNLITLRGIYEYIMNNFPYYKYCHDKSAWQNSIRHNLSLNQCFVKVPRYENAAKSNYWTMTREGFEEFGNENSFKRRRRRGAALAPISAYKAKKCTSDGSKTIGKNKCDTKRSSPNAGTASMSASPGEDYLQIAPHLMSLAARSWAPNLRTDATQMQSRKRSVSPLEYESAKQQKMMVLKSGDGPNLGQVSVEDNNRSGSPSPVEEMQEAFNSYSKTLLGSSAFCKTASNREQAFPSVLSSWTPQSIATGMLMSSAIPNGKETFSEKMTNMTTDDLKESANSVVMDGIEIGSELVSRSDATDVSLRHFRCRFCSYAYISTSALMLEKHVRLLHHAEITNEKAKAAVAATASSSQGDKISELDATRQLMSFQNMMSGLSSASMMAAAQTNASNLLAATQATAGTSITGFPYSGSFSSGFLNESIMRSMAEQSASSRSVQNEQDPSNFDAYAFQRQQQALNNAIQQAAAAAVASPSLVSQEPLRLLYQQIAMNNPFLANSGLFQRQISTSESDQPSQLKQLYQYQKFFNHMKSLSDDIAAPTTSSANKPAASKLSSSSYEVESDVKRSIHGWKQCRRCSFTAKGEHGLELHYRKVHTDVTGDEIAREIRQFALNGNDDGFVAESEQQANKTKTEQPCDVPLVSSAFPTPPLSNSPSYIKKNFGALDLRGSKDENPAQTATVSASTQTAESLDQIKSSGNRTCHHCDIVFGDEMMHALHMSCHDKNEPFKCKICGLCCNERYYFNVHLLRGMHNQPSSNPSLVPDSSTEILASSEPVVGSRCGSNGAETPPSEKRCHSTEESYEMPACQQ